MTGERLQNRWGIALVAICVQICLGSNYGWSVFKNPLMTTEHWAETPVQLSFTLAVVFLGVGAILGGLWQDRIGPRSVAAIAGVCNGGGYILASLSISHHFLYGLYLGYGVLAGIGMGMGHICAVAMLLKWFPDRRGLMTGFAACGFAFGSLLMSPFAAWEIIHFGVPATFRTLGVAYLIIVVVGAQFFVNPSEGWRPLGWEPRTPVAKAAGVNSFTVFEALGTYPFYILLLIHFMSVSAGVMIISQASPMAQEMVGMPVLKAAGVVGLISIFNGLGRLLWSWLSDYVGRIRVFAMLFVIQAMMFFLLPRVQNWTIASIVFAMIGMCYGGAIGTLPSLTADYFGPKAIGAIYGLIIFGGNFAGIPSPIMIARIHERSGTYVPAVNVLAVLLLCSLILPLLVRQPIKRPGISPASTAAD